jgi:hypothetical protein
MLDEIAAAPWNTIRGRDESPGSAKGVIAVKPSSQ